MLLDIFDPKAPPRAIGIDLGTTNSVVAYVRDGRPAPVITCDGVPLLPSVVHYPAGGTPHVGRTALAFATREPERTISSAKRLMGRGADDAETRKLAAARFAQPQNAQEAKVARFDVGERQVSPVEVSAEILKSLLTSAKSELTHVGGVVITVPAYFDDAQRQATRDAGRLAGLEVLRLLNEPTAAALAYGLDKQQNGLFVVYDLGGGTFDVTILELDDGVFQVKSTGGDSALGGDDMDRALAERMLIAMGYETTSELAAEVVSLVLAEARALKHRLTEAAEATVTLPRRAGGAVPFSVTRAEFESWILPLLERTGRVCKRALRDADIAATQLDGVILVGGSTRVPRVRSYVQEIFGREALADIDPDLVVAFGAAIQADLLARASDEVLLLDVLPLSLGIETMGGGVDKILPRNTPIPAGAKASFTTYADNQTGFELHVVQGERELAQDCRSLARFSLKGIPALPAGLARLEVTFHVDENNLLEVTATELTTGLRQIVEVRPSYGLTDEQVEAMLIDALDHGEADFEARRLADARVDAARILLATHKAIAADSDLLSPEERLVLDQAIFRLETAAGQTVDARAIQAAIDELERSTQAWAGRRMNRAIAQAISGKNVGDVESQVAHAAGVDAHVQTHLTQPSTQK